MAGRPPLRTLLLATLLLPTLLLGACTTRTESSAPLPAILEGATTTGGANFLCHPADTPPALVTTPETTAHSPELVERLKRDFPAGTPETKLIAALKGWGFEVSRCEHDATIGFARFDRQQIDETRIFGVMVARMLSGSMGTVEWKADPQGLIVWTTGNVGFIGL